MIDQAITKISQKESLTLTEAQQAMDDIMAGRATQSQIAAFLIGLRVKGETEEEIAGCAQSMRAHATPIQTRRTNVIDTCGTGGDNVGTFNISTAAAIVASSAGANVAKHGNRAVSSRCGSADVLKALGVNIEIDPAQAGRVLDEVGITFLFAPLLHEAMKYAAPVRKELGVRTIFNILGPLTNPARARRQVVGVFDPNLTETLARVMKVLGGEHVLVVHGEGGLDELSTVGKTRVSEVRNGEVLSYSVGVEELGIRRASVQELKGGDAQVNADVIRGILSGHYDGAPKDVVVLNAGAALYTSGLASSIRDGVTMAKEAIDSRAASRKLKAWIEASRS